MVFKGERFLKKIILDTKTHYRPMETFQYTQFTSCHPPEVKRGFNKGEAILGNPGADSWVMRKLKRPISLQERKRSLWDSSFKQLSVIGNKNILVPTQGAALFVLLS